MPLGQTDAERLGLPSSPLPDARYETLDAWRGIACLGVVAFHAVGRYVDESHGGLAFAPIRLAAEGGWIGVPLFFTISGYCIAAAARATRDEYRPAADFFRRRFRRIYPPFAFALAFTALVAVVGHALSAAGIANGLWDRLDIGWHWLTNALLLEESLRLFGIAPDSANAPAWSLCYEAQFYAFMGVCFLATSAARRGAALVATSVASIALAAAFGPSRIGILTDVWPLFALGIWVHERARGRGSRGSIAWDLWAGGTVAGILVAYRLESGRLGQEAKAVAICAAFAVALLALRPRDAALARNRIVSALSSLGRRSYSIYLLHFPIVCSIGDSVYPLGLTKGWLLYATALVSSAVAIGLAYVFHATVERRFLPRPHLRSS